MRDITKPEKPVKELLILFRSRGSKSCAWRYIYIYVFFSYSYVI